MTEDLKVALADFIKRLIDLVNSGTDQLPNILKEVVGAALLSATIWWWVGVILICLGIVFMITALISDSSDNGGPFFFGGVLFLLGIPITAINWYNYLYATRFPNLVILDYLRGFIR